MPRDMNRPEIDRPTGDETKPRHREVEPDREIYDRAGKGRDPELLKRIPTRELREFMKNDTDSWRAGAAEHELRRRERDNEPTPRERPDR